MEHVRRRHLRSRIDHGDRPHQRDELPLPCDGAKRCGRRRGVECKCERDPYRADHDNLIDNIVHNFIHDIHVIHHDHHHGRADKYNDNINVKYNDISYDNVVDNLNVEYVNDRRANDHATTINTLDAPARRSSGDTFTCRSSVRPTCHFAQFGATSAGHRLRRCGETVGCRHVCGWRGRRSGQTAARSRAASRCRRLSIVGTTRAGRQGHGRRGGIR